MRKRKTNRTWRGIVRRRKALKAAELRKQRSRRFDRRLMRLQPWFRQAQPGGFR